MRRKSNWLHEGSIPFRSTIYSQTKINKMNFKKILIYRHGKRIGKFQEKILLRSINVWDKFQPNKAWRLQIEPQSDFYEA